MSAICSKFDNNGKCVRCGKVPYACALPSRTVTTCRLCRSPRLVGMLSLPPTPPANAFQKTGELAKALSAYPLNVMRCSTCGHHQLDTVVDGKVLFSDYVYASGTSKVFVEHFARYADRVAEVAWSGREPGGPLRALEIGSNDGTFLRELKKNGFEVQGVEPAAGLAERANAVGLPTVNRFFDVETALDLQFGRPSFDVWTANNVLAHIDDFVGTLQALHHCCHDLTVGVFEVQYLQSLWEMGAFDLQYHEHLDYWRLSELVEWLPKMTGWYVEDAEVVATHGGSLRVWVRKDCQACHMLSQRGIDILVAEEALNVGEAWSSLRTRIQQTKTNLHKLIDSMPSPLCVVGYGAPAKLTTFLTTLDLAKKLAYVVDDSPLKQGLFAPGSGVPVKDATALKAEGLQPSAIIITAWNFADSIAKKLRAGGITCPLIVPFPEVKVMKN